MIRKTWANSTEFNHETFDEIHSNFNGDYLPINSTSSSVLSIRTIFLVGQSESNETNDDIKKESSLTNDIIQENFLDSYNNLTLKTVMLLKWVNKKCSKKGKLGQHFYWSIVLESFFLLFGFL